MLELKERLSVSGVVQDDPFAAERWKILLRLKDAEGPTWWGEMVFGIRKANDAQCGSGDMVWTKGGRASPAVETDVEGFIGPMTTRLQLYMLQRPLGHSPFICEGAAVTPDLHYNGAWHADCLDPIECACGGSSGDFTLARLG
jgi:hypothetical protein